VQGIAAWGIAANGIARHAADGAVAMHDGYLRHTDLGFLDICTPRIRAVYEYWNGKRGDRAMPARRDLDPFELRGFLPGIILVDVGDDPLEMTYRLVGTDEVRARGNDPTGKKVRAHVFGENAEDAFTTYLLAATKAVPVYDREAQDCLNPWLRLAGSLVLPLSDDGKRVNMLFTFVDYQALR
jgi:hypothetical protein